MAYSYTLSGTSKYIQRLTGVHSPIIKRPIHNLADGTALALIFDENDPTAKYGTKNNVAKALLYQSNADRTTWTLRASYTIPSGTFPTGTATIHGGACLMNDESLYFVWRGVPDSGAPGYEVRGAVFSKTGANTWANPTSNELLFSPTTRFPYRFDLDRNTVTNHIFIGWMYRDDLSTAARTGVRVCIRKSPTDRTVMNLWEGVGTNGNVAHLTNAEDFSLAVDPISNSSYTRIHYITSASMASKDYGDYLGWVLVNNSTSAFTGKNWIKTGFNAGFGAGRRTTYLFATANGEFAVIGMGGSTSGKVFATRYKTTAAVTATPTYTIPVPLKYSSASYAMNRTGSVWNDCSVTYANSKFAVHFHDASTFRDVVGRFVTNPANGLTSVVWEAPTFTWDSFSGTGITITETWRKAPAGAVYGGSRTASATNIHDTLLVRYSRTSPTGFDTGWASQHNRAWKAPNSVSPTANTTVNTSLPVLSAYGDIDQPAARSPVWVKWQVASNNSFTTNLKEVESAGGTIVTNSHLNGTQTYIAQKLTQALALSTGTWYIRAAQRDIFGIQGAWSTVQQFNVAHPPWATDLGPSGSSVFQYGTGNVTFTWTFKDSYELDAQTAYRIVVEMNNDESTVVLDTGKVVSTSDFATLLIPDTAKNTQLKWHVQLWDVDDNAGDLSSYSLFTVADPPVVTIVTPAQDAVVDNARPQVEWITDDPLGTGQASFRVYFVSQGIMIHDSGWRNGADQSYQPDDIILANESSYSMTIQVRDGAALEGQSSVSFDTEWILPPSPNLSQLYVDTSSYDNVGGGYVRVVWENQTADPEFLSWRLYRRYHLASAAKEDDKGWQWELLHEEFSVSPPDDGEQFVFLDYTAPSGYEVHYTLTQAAVRFGSIVESSKPQIEDTGRQVSLYSEHYWLIMPQPSGLVEDVLRLENATADSYTEEYETEEMHLIGRGRHFEVGDRLGYAGSLTLQLRFIDGSNLLGDPRRQKLDLENFKAKRTECWIRSPFGDLFMAFTGDMQFERVAGVGRSEFTNVSLPYKEVYKSAD